MEYRSVLVKDPLKDEIIGYAIQKVGTMKLESSNIWNPTNALDIVDLNLQLKRLNEQSIILSFWPDARDPDVIKLVDDDSFEPLEKKLVVEEGKRILLADPSAIQARMRKAHETVARRRAGLND